MTFRRLLVRALATSVVICTGAQAQTDPGRQSSAADLSIASVSVAGRPAVAPAPPAAPRSAWRHTFGSERRGKGPEMIRQPARFTADVVVLQGVVSLAQVRQLFPAQSHNLVLSRQIMIHAAAAGTGHGHPATGTTAIAIRRSPELRVVAQDHLAALAEPPPGTNISLAAGTAVRLASWGRSVWVLAVDLAGCDGVDSRREGVAACRAAERQLDAIARWSEDRRTAGDAVILAGRFHRSLDDDALPAGLQDLARFPAGSPAGACTDAGRSDAMHVLAASRRPGEGFTLDGQLIVADEKDPESGCALVVRVRAP